MLTSSQNSMFFTKSKIYSLKRRVSYGFICLIFAVLGAFIVPQVLYANDAEVSRLNQQINQKRDELSKLDAEINRQREALNAVAGQSKTLQDAVNQLEATRRKLRNDISRTQTEIERAELTIQKLNLEIVDKNRLIKTNSDALAESIRRMNQMEQTTLIEKFLGFESMSDFWTDFELTQQLQKRFRDEVNILVDLSKELRQKEVSQKQEKDNLAQQITILAGETEVVQETVAEQASLLERTRSEEAEYQRLLNQKLAERRAFEEEMLQMESQLNFLIDTNSYPSPRNGILAWPLDNIRVTQEFGGSQFAAQNPHIYGRPFHPGTDFGAPVGTQIKSVHDGVVKAVGNTDDFPGCFAWGRWLLIDHDNGLSSLYAHLSRNLVEVGQRVKKGQVVALSGNTGYSTGPHLHLTIYASQGVRVGQYTGTGGCGRAGAIGPFADLDAYLDPMLYLPTL